MNKLLFRRCGGPQVGGQQRRIAFKFCETKRKRNERSVRSSRFFDPLGSICRPSSESKRRFGEIPNPRADRLLPALECDRLRAGGAGRRAALGLIAHNTI